MTQPVLEAGRLVLRPFEPADAPVVQQLAGDRAVAETTLNIPHPYPDGAAEAWIAMHPQEWAAGAGATFAIVADAQLVGAIALHLSPRHHRGELGYWVGKPFWGRGIATDSARAMLAFGFTELNLNRIQASHLPGNPASGRVMEKLGMTREGLHRERYCKNGVYQDVVEYAILRREWKP